MIQSATVSGNSAAVSRNIEVFGKSWWNWSWQDIPILSVCSCTLSEWIIIIRKIEIPIIIIIGAFENGCLSNTLKIDQIQSIGNYPERKSKLKSKFEIRVGCSLQLLKSYNCNPLLLIFIASISRNFFQGILYFYCNEIKEAQSFRSKKLTLFRRSTVTIVARGGSIGCSSRIKDISTRRIFH